LLLQKLFSLEFGMQTASENDFQNYLNRVIFMNQEFLKKYVHILEEKLSQSSLQRDYKDLEVSQLKSQIEKLEKVSFLSHFQKNLVFLIETYQFPRKSETIFDNRQIR